MMRNRTIVERLAGIGRAALALLVFAAGMVCPASQAEAQTAETDIVFAVTSDYAVRGSCSSLDVLPPWGTDVSLTPLHSDAIARVYDGLVYVVNRLYADNVQVLDPSQGFATIRQFSVGPGSNPMDIAILSPTRAYVSRYETPWLLEIDPSTGAIADSIDLSVFADADGLPEAAAMAIVDDLLFVAIQRIDRDYYWLPVAPSWLAVIDTQTNTLIDVDPVEPGIQGVMLTSTNPYTDILVGEDGITLYVGESGRWDLLDGGIEAVDTSSLTALGHVITEVELGGELQDFALPLAGRAHAAISVASPGWESFCVAFDWEAGELLETVWRPGEWSVPDIEVHEGTLQLFVADGTYAAPGVRVFDALTGVQLAGLIDVSLPPHDLVLVGDSVTAVAGNAPDGTDDAAEAPEARLLAAPNPSRGDVMLALELSVGGSVPRIAIYDVAGRLVRTLESRVPVLWNGRDECGRPVASGVYFARASWAGGEATARIALIR
ncbi:hypothetical protein K8S17_03785 [bacterium]|nr:hypothetical protein [bacterium]